MSPYPTDRQWTRVIITGDRRWNCQDLADQVVARLRDRYGDALMIVHGGCEGVDRAFDSAAELLGVSRDIHPADWEREGKAAGPKRNARMIAKGAAFVIAVHKSLGWSKSTRNCVELAFAGGIPVYLIDNPAGEARRITTIVRHEPHPKSPTQPATESDPES